MPKIIKSAAYKRRLRCSQKAKKRKESRSTSINEDRTSIGEDSESTAAGPSSAVPAPSAPSLPLSAASNNLKLRCKAVEEQLRHTTECMNYYYKQVVVQEKRASAMETECRRKIKSIRHFWKDKIYNEQTRGGILLKTSVTDLV